METVHVAIGIIIREGRILLTRRAKEDRFAGKWEFPGGKVQESESSSATVHRELAEELGISVVILGRMAPITHDYGDLKVTLHPFVVEMSGGEPSCRSAEEMGWFLAAEVAKLPFPEANRELLESLPSVLRTLGCGG